MSDLFEYYNGVKLPSSKIITDFTDSLVIHFLVVKKLESSFSKYSDKICKIEKEISSNDNREHVIIIFVNSIPTVNYDGYIFILNENRVFVNKPINKSFTLTNERIINPSVNGISKFIEMKTCWNIIFKVNDNDINFLSFACINKTREQISRLYEKEIKAISTKLKISDEQVISKLIVASKNLDYYEFENTIETKFFKEDPNLIELVNSTDSIHIINSEVSLLDTFIPSLIYSIISMKESIMIYISGKYIRNIIYRFRGNLFEFVSDSIEENIEEQTDENADEDDITEELKTIICSNSMMSNNQSCMNFINKIKEYKYVLLYTKEKLNKSTSLSKYVRVLYEPYINHLKINKQFIQEDDIHFVLDGCTYFNLTNSTLDIKSILFTDDCKSDSEINIKSSINSLQKIAAMLSI